MRLGKEEEAASAAAPSKLAAVAEKISGDLPGFFNASDESQDEEEAKTKAVFAFHEATVAAWLASGAPKEAELSLDALLALRKKKKKKPKTSLLLSSAAVADALASRLSSSARKEAAAAASSSYDYSRLLEAAAESCLEFAREVGGGEGGEQEEGKKTTAAGALVAAFDLALDAEAASEGEGESSKATALWREAAAALSSPSSSLDAAAATAAASEASAFTRWREAFEGTSSSSSSPQQQPGPLDAATRASLREGLRARWSRVAAATSSSSSKSLTRSSSSSSSSSSPSSPLSALPPASVLIALAKLSLSEREADDARRASRAALKSAKARGLPAASEAFLSARVAAARAAALSSSSSSSVLDREELSSIRDAAPQDAYSRPFSAAREAAVLLLVSSNDDAKDDGDLRSLAGSLVEGRPEHWLLAALGTLHLRSGRSEEAAASFKEAAEEAARGRGASTDSEAAEHWLALGRALSVNFSSPLPPPPPPASAAAAWLKAAAVPGPAQAPAFAELGAFYRDARGDGTRALACFRRCLDLDPSVERAGRGATSFLLLLSADSGSVSKAKAIAKRATERAPDSPWAWRALADACLAQARGRGSERSKSCASSSSPPAAASEAAADAASALVGLLRCSSLPSNDIPRAWSDLGDCYLVAGRPGSALRAFERCVELLEGGQGGGGGGEGGGGGGGG